MNFATILLMAWGALVVSVPANAFEAKRPDTERRLSIEIEPVSPVQQNFDQYVREVAAAAQRDAHAARQEKTKVEELREKALNPLTLLRW